VAAGVAVGIQLALRGEIAERADRNWALARSFPIHGRSSLFVLVMLGRLGGGCQLPDKGAGDGGWRLHLIRLATPRSCARLGSSNRSPKPTSRRHGIFIMAVTRTDLVAARDHLEQAIEHQTLRLTIRLGGIMVAGIAVIVALQRLLRTGCCREGGSKVESAAPIRQPAIERHVVPCAGAIVGKRASRRRAPRAQSRTTAHPGQC